ncbi:MAG TPA: sulfatase-like hydrolase/transferase [Sedimentisphaerales bacterium]|nr:sulfatase-like hydrolase/transferase [Sedimentisphaerales bacterium]
MNNVLDRRDFLKAIGLGAASLAVPGCFSASSKSSGKSAADKPNIVLILVDDLGWRDVSYGVGYGYSGSGYYETPNLEKLAGQGMRFTDAYAACPVCSPTRASIMTGKYPARIYLTDWINGHERPNAKLKIPNWTHYMRLEEVTIAEALKAAGYATCHVGKWHLGDDAIYWPENQGFDVNKGGWKAGHPAGPGKYFTPYRNPRLEDGPPGEYLTDREAMEAVRFIEQNRHRPFFLYMAHYAVHAPMMAKQGIIDKYQAKTSTPEHNNATYAAMIQSVDEALGRVMEKLEELNIAERTIMIFMSDNGGLLGKTNNWPLRGGKAQAYEGGIREPMIIKWPGVVKLGSVCNEPVISTDFYPTILEMVCLPPRPEQHIDGVSLVPLLKARGSLDRDALYWHYPHYHPQNPRGPFGAIRKGDWKLIEYYEDMDVELYNIGKDLGEKVNLAETNPAKANELRDMLHAWRASVGAQMPTRNPAFTAAQ